MKKHLQPLTPAALYARVSSDRQDVDLSVAAQLRALRDYAKANGYSVAREYVDEAESGRVADRPQFREMIDEGSQPKAPFEVILVWKFSRFTRKREHAVAFKSMLRRKGVKVVSITEHADDSPTGTVASPNHGIMKRARGKAMHITAASGSRLTTTNQVKRSTSSSQVEPKAKSEEDRNTDKRTTQRSG